MADLTGLVHARDAALGKVAAIGTVNPRAGGPLNSLVQAWKRLVARVLDWHVREQVESSRKAVACVDAAIEALNQSNRALIEFGNRLAAERARREELEKPLREQSQEMSDIRHHWAEWRAGWEQKLTTNEMQFQRSVADLDGAFQYWSAVRTPYSPMVIRLDRPPARHWMTKLLWPDGITIRPKPRSDLLHMKTRSLSAGR